MSVIRYPGGKTRAIKILSEFVSSSSEKVLLSPFCGGLSFELHLASRNFTIYANDKFEPLINFWSQVKDQRDDVLYSLSTIPYPLPKEFFTHFRDNILDLSIHPASRAAAYFAINRCSFSGATLSGGYSKDAAEKRFTSSSIQRLRDVDLTRVNFSCLDFEDFFNLHPEGLIYADPPYYLDNPKLYGMKGDMHEDMDHVKLRNLLYKRNNWILSYNNCDYIKELYAECDIKQVQWTYGMTSKDSSEIVITPRW